MAPRRASPWRCSTTPRAARAARRACLRAAEANGLEPDTAMSGGIWQLPLDLNAQTKNIIKLCEADGHRSGPSSSGSACTVWTRRACRAARSARSRRTQSRRRRRGSRRAASAAATARSPARTRVPKFEWNRFNPKIVKCEFCRSSAGRGARAGVHRRLPRGGGDLRDPGHAARRRARRASPPRRGSTSRSASTASTRAAARRCSTSRTFHSRRSASRRSVRPRTRSTRGSGRAGSTGGSAGPIALYAVVAGVIHHRWRRHETEAHQRERETGLKEQL